MSRRALICLALTVGCTASFAGVTVVVAPRPVVVPRVAPPVRVAPPAAPKAAPAAPVAAPKNATAQEGAQSAAPAARAPVVVPIVVPHAGAAREQDCSPERKDTRASKAGKASASDCPAAKRP